MRTRIKICGIRTPEDADAAAEAGAEDDGDFGFERTELGAIHRTLFNNLTKMLSNF